MWSFTIEPTWNPCWSLAALASGRNHPYRLRLSRSERPNRDAELAPARNDCQFVVIWMADAHSALDPPRGNALTHGAYSMDLVSPRVRELTRHVFDTNAHLDGGRDGPAVSRYAVLLARIERVYLWLADQADEVFDDLAAGSTHAVYDRLGRWESQCDNAERALAIAPLTRARLGLTVAAALDAATMLSEPDPDLRRRMLERAGLIDGRGVGVAIDDR